MDRAARDRFVASTDQDDLDYGESACLETPPDFFEKLNAGFHFDIDLTANEKNHLLPIWMGPGSPIGRPDALATEWYFVPTVYQQNNGAVASTRGFSNPPYGKFIERILRKAVEDAAHGFTSVFLLPMRASSWYTEIVLVHATHLWHLEPRLTFWYNGQPKPTAKVKATKKEIARWVGEGSRVTGCPYIDDDGYWHLEDGGYRLAPANALFDSIVVVFSPQLSGLPHIPYTVCPKVWRWKEQPVTDLL